MICKNCGKQLQNSKIEKCPHCNSETGFVATGNGFYDILAQNVSVASSGTSSAPAGDGPAAKETLNIAKRTANQAARNEWFIKVGLLASAVSVVLILVVLILVIALRPGLKSDIKDLLDVDEPSETAEIDAEKGGNGVEPGKNFVPAIDEEPLFVIPVNVLPNDISDALTEADDIVAMVTIGEKSKSIGIFNDVDNKTISLYGEIAEGQKGFITIYWATKTDKPFMYENADSFDFGFENGHVEINGEELEMKVEENMPPAKDGEDKVVVTLILTDEIVGEASAIVKINTEEYEVDEVSDKKISVTVDKSILKTEDEDNTVSVTVTQVDGDVEIKRESGEKTFNYGGN